MPKPSWKAAKLIEKVEAGAQFLQTHICMDTRVLSAYMRYLVSNRFIRRTSISGSVAVLESAEDAEWLRENRPNVNIPDQMVERLRSAADPKAEGIRICAETLKAISGIPGMVGANIMASRNLETIPEVVRAADLA